MQVVSVAEEIEKRIKLLTRTKEELRERTEAKANAIAEYEKRLAIVIIGLKNGKEFEIDGEKIQNPPATIIEKVAKGVCWREKLEMDKAETSYKSLITAIECIKAELNGYQSIYKHLDEK